MNNDQNKQGFQGGNQQPGGGAQKPGKPGADGREASAADAKKTGIKVEAGKDSKEADTADNAVRPN